MEELAKKAMRATHRIYVNNHINNLITEHVPDYEHYECHKHGRITEKTNAISQKILKQQTRTKLQYHYMNNTWKVRLEGFSKLESYREVKTD